MENIGSDSTKLRHFSRLVVLSEFVDATQNSTGYYWAKIISGLAREFDEVCVICPLSSYRAIAGPLPNVTYFPFRDRIFNKNKILSRLLGQVVQALNVSWVLIRRVKRRDVVFSGTNPAVALLFVGTLKRIIGFKWLLLVHDVFPENLVPAGILRNDSWLYLVVRRIFAIVYSLADILVAIGRDMREALVRKTKNDSRVIYIPNWVDADDVLPILRASNELLPEDSWKNKTVFQFFGNLGRVQGLDNLLLALPHVKNTNAGFVFIGSGAQEKLITAFMDRYPRLSVIRVPRLSFADNGRGLSACDVAIVSLAKGMEGLAVPSKAYFSLAADKPLLVVADENSELHMLVRESKGLGWFCQSGDPIALAETIDAICNLNLAELRGSPRLAVIQRFSYSNAIKLYAQCVRELGAETADVCA